MTDTAVHCRLSNDTVVSYVVLFHDINKGTCIYSSVKSIGPNTEPCGTPLERSVGSDVLSLILTL